MADRGVVKMAVGAAICRLIEQYQPPETRLFHDPVAQALVGATMRTLMRFPAIRRYAIRKTDAVVKGIHGAHVCRTCFMDDVVVDALQAGTGQVLILGAGLDTRPYRLPGIERARVFETDLESVQKMKLRRLKRYFGRPPQNVEFVPMDFRTQSLDEALSETAFDRRKRTVVVWEGITQYMPESAVRQTLSFVGSCAAGSVLGFTYVLKNIIERRPVAPDSASLIRCMEKSDLPWVFGLEPSEVRAFLQACGLVLVEDLTGAGYQKRYLQPRGRTLFVSDGEHSVKAAVVAR